MILVKICGLTRLSDALHAASAGADLLGFVFAPSPRQADPQAVGAMASQLKGSFPRVGRVGVFVDPGEDELARICEQADLTHAQIYGTRPVQLPKGLPWIAAVALTGAGEAVVPLGDPWAVLLEPGKVGQGGGTGRTFPWEWARPWIQRTRVLIAGGLDADRVPELLQSVVPFGVDASSRLEREPGIKDPAKVEAFIQAVRREEARHEVAG